MTFGRRFLRRQLSDGNWPHSAVARSSHDGLACDVPAKDNMIGDRPCPRSVREHSASTNGRTTATRVRSCDRRCSAPFDLQLIINVKLSAFADRSDRPDENPFPLLFGLAVWSA